MFTSQAQNLTSAVQRQIYYSMVVKFITKAINSERNVPLAKADNNQNVLFSLETLSTIGFLATERSSKIREKSK